MFIVATTGPNNSTEAVLPFIAGRGAMSRGEDVDAFLMQEATSLVSAEHADLTELKALGLPTVATVLDELRDTDALGEVIACEPCAVARNISEGDLRAFADLQVSSGPRPAGSQPRRDGYVLTGPISPAHQRTLHPAE